MPRPYLTAIQAETMARMHYGLPPRNHKGRPLRNQHVVKQALMRKQLISGRYLTELGLRELRAYCKRAMEKHP